MTNPTVAHQGFQDFPKLDAPIIDETGKLTYSWYRLLIRFWQALGLNVTGYLNTSFLQATPTASTPVTVFGIGPTGAPVPIGPVPIPGSAAANQITFDTLMIATPQDPARKGSIGPTIDSLSALAFQTPPDPQRVPLYAYLDTTAAPVAYSLPATPYVSMTVIVVDAKGNAGANNITVTSPSGANINGLPSFLLTSNYEVDTFAWNGSQWYVVARAI